MPVGRPGGSQHLAVFDLRADGELRETNLGAVAFVPLVGEEAWPER
jgi:protein-L-isoaspartate O-methyltransferase